MPLFRVVTNDQRFACNGDETDFGIRNLHTISDSPHSLKPLKIRIGG